jgi:hypothetical protein
MGGNIGFNSGLSTAESTIGMNTNRDFQTAREAMSSDVVKVPVKRKMLLRIACKIATSQILPDASAHSKDGSLAEGTIA